MEILPKLQQPETAELQFLAARRCRATCIYCGASAPHDGGVKPSMEEV
jgi:hypothetical protein